MIKNSNKCLVLASASPRRKELLLACGLQLEVCRPDVSEDMKQDLPPQDYVCELAARKALFVARSFSGQFVLGADTIVVLENDAGGAAILNKPADSAEAVSMLGRLQGKEHTVFTGFCLVDRKQEVAVCRAVSSKVTFRPMAQDEIKAYVATGEPLDKAGAYAVQGIGSIFIRSIVGSYTNVIGLPLCEVVEELKRFGVWQESILWSNRT